MNRAGRNRAGRSQAGKATNARGDRSGPLGPIVFPSGSRSLRPLRPQSSARASAIAPARKPRRSQPVCAPQRGTKACSKPGLTAPPESFPSKPVRGSKKTALSEDPNCAAAGWRPIGMRTGGPDRSGAQPDSIFPICQLLSVSCCGTGRGRPRSSCRSRRPGPWPRASSRRASRRRSRAVRASPWTGSGTWTGSRDSRRA